MSVKIDKYEGLYMALYIHVYSEFLFEERDFIGIVMTTGTITAINTDPS